MFQVLIGILTMAVISAEIKEAYLVSSPYRYSNNT